LRVIAVDWSGAASPRAQRETIWLAEATGGRLARVEGGRDRDELAEHLIHESARDPRLVIGLDFAFSLPAWFLDELGIARARDLWKRMAAEAEEWLAGPRPPFWRAAGSAPERPFRQTELEVRKLGAPAQSVFKLVGAGQVGPGSLRGMAVLDRLVEAGFHVWPFDTGGPLVVEIYPRVLRRELAASERIALEDLREHAYDAALSALVMARHAAELTALTPDPAYGLEGRIWRPRSRPPASLHSGT
jgi:predicted nuclease with RNAse H fold